MTLELLPAGVNDAPPTQRAAPQSRTNSGFEPPKRRIPVSDSPPAFPIPAQTKTLTLEDELPEGARVGDYEIIRLIGRGGMGTVYLARDLRLTRKVAIKFLSLQSELVEKRFLTEARTLASFQHENIVTLHDIGKLGSLNYMVMEYLEGHTLSEEILAGPIPQSRSIEIIAAVARALLKAHSLGIVHRDLKPDNIFLTSSGQVKVLDFGIAKLMPNGEEGPPSSRTPAQLASITALRSIYHTLSRGSLVGTIPYMAPEQWSQSKVDARTDIFTLGLIAFELVAGSHPVATDERTQHQFSLFMLDPSVPLPRLSEVRGGVSELLERIVARCLEKDPGARYQSVKELVRELGLLQAPSELREFRDEPFVGLASFEEADRLRYFGREAQVSVLHQKLLKHPITGVVGPSGVGKSSLVRAALVGRLRFSEESWKVRFVRPGANLMNALAELVATLQGRVDGVSASELVLRHAERFTEHPHEFGLFLREHARVTRSNLLIVIDQLEEAITFRHERELIAKWLDALLGAADDASSPVRVCFTIRSDWLDKFSFHEGFLREFSKGLMMLGPPSAHDLRAALVGPLERRGYDFEKESDALDILTRLQQCAHPFPILQLIGQELWKQRDRQNKRIPALGKVSFKSLDDAIANHAESAFSILDEIDKNIGEALLARLATAEGTRIPTAKAALLEHFTDAERTARIIEHLLSTRIIASADGSTLELAHEVLLVAWPRMVQLRERSAFDNGLRRDLALAVERYFAKGRSPDLLWSGSTERELRDFRMRNTLPLSPKELEFALASEKKERKRRHRKTMVFSGFATLVMLLLVGGAVSYRKIYRAQSVAVHNEYVARREQERAKAAESEVRRQLAIITEKEQQRVAAETRAILAVQAADLTKAELEVAYGRLQAHVELLVETERRRAEEELARKHAEGQALSALAETKASRSELESSFAQLRGRLALLERAHTSSDGAKLSTVTALAPSAAFDLNREDLETNYAKLWALSKNLERIAEKATQAETAARETSAQLESLLEQARSREAKQTRLSSKIATELR